MADLSPSTASGHGLVSFPPTRWSLFVDPRENPVEAAQALRELCQHYRDAIENWFRLRLPDEAADLTHGFVEQWLSREQSYKVEQRDGSRFRYYLAAALKNFLNDYFAREQAQKRGGGARRESIEQLRESGFEPPADDSTHPSSLDSALSLSIHRKVMAALQRAAADPTRFQHLSQFVPFEQGDESYVEVAKNLGLTPGAVRTAVHRLRDDYFDAFREEVRQMTRAGDPVADEELRYLMEILPGALERQSAG